ncbi:MAG: pyridoxamine 5'-phosphate oxidase family protein [Celeribacter sp.]|jgi:putative heme iron utilization protein
MPDAAPGPIRPTDEAARAQARDLIDTARFAALGVLSDGMPLVSRVALATDASGTPVSLISDLALHTGALRVTPACSLLLGEPGAKGDPLTYPRLTLQARADFVPRDSTAHITLRDRYLALRPKSALYLDFADFHFVRFVPVAAMLNGGFGRAFHLTPADLILPS